VLDLLAQYNAKATFFCIRRNAERHNYIMKRIVSEGHTFGNLTYSHLKGWYTPDADYYADIRLCSRFVPSTLYRPAYGMITPAQVRRLKKQFKLVLWDVMSYDFDPKTNGARCLRNVIRYSRPGSVIVFHDSVKASEKVLYALPRVLEYFNEMGYRFGAVI
jgi:peptidoglycan/xylan/chitin deacetylase (PgdA/CDA1 family)